MTTDFTLVLDDSMFNIFEREVCEYFEDNPMLTSWLAYTFEVHICGHKDIDYIDFSLKDSIATFEVKVRDSACSWICYPAGQAKINYPYDIVEEIMKRIK